MRPAHGSSPATDRLRAVVGAAAPEHGDAPDAALPKLAESLLTADEAGVLWLTLAVLRARLPGVADVEQARRVVRFDGARDLLRRELAGVGADLAAGPVRVLADAASVDVNHTAGVESTSGIQRVVRETARRWQHTADATFVGWTHGYRALRHLTPAEHSRLMGEPRPDGAPRAESSQPEVALVPWRGVYICAEMAAEPERAGVLRALARFSRTEVAFVGHDCIPVTSPGTVTGDFIAKFLDYLAAVRDSHRLAVTSQASSGEFRGWRRMLRAAGHPGPDIAEIQLPVQAESPAREDLAAARASLTIPSVPLVLVVGSHEPRKNHLAVLHAAELLWREGRRFTLVLVGGLSWKGDRFRMRVDELQRAGRQVQAISGMPDRLLWAAYRLASFVVFPSLNEGFGLPVAEALAGGTPVVTSDFGSMRQIVAPAGVARGGLLVDPRDDRAIATAMRRLLVDDELRERLQAEARARAPWTWDDYAAATWAFLANTASAT